MAKAPYKGKKDGEVTVYEIEVTVEELEQPIEVPMSDKETRLVIRLAPRKFLFSV